MMSLTEDINAVMENRVILRVWTINHHNEIAYIVKPLKKHDLREYIWV